MPKQKIAYAICYRSKDEALAEPKTPWVLFLHYENVNDLAEFIEQKLTSLREELSCKEFIGGKVISTVIPAVKIPSSGLCLETGRKFDIRIKPNV